MRSALALLAAISPALAGVHELWWNLTYVQDVDPDGLFSRRAIGVNGTWPPPPIHVNTTDIIRIHATNYLDDPTTLHHHGMFFNQTPWMDGALGVSQCGIPYGQTFDYEVPVNSSNQWGTYWVHSHNGGHYVDGLRAPVVIHPPQEKYQYDGDFTVILADWYHTEHAELLKKFVSVANPGGAEPIPNAGIVYFSQGEQYLPPISGRNPPGSTSHVGFGENATLPFEPGKTYRLRILNSGAFAGFYFWIDGHDMRIIEVDGTDIEETPIDLLGITVAQRYSVLVTARNDTSSNWAIHANMDTVMFDRVPPALNPNVTSSITYNASAPITDYGFIDAYHDIDDINFVPVEVEAMPPANKKIELEVSFDTMDDGTNHAMFNLITYNSPLVPTIFSQVSLGANATNADAYGPYSFVLDHLDVFDLVVKNSDVGKHPFHIHGHKFQIVGRSTDYQSSDPTLNPPLIEGQANPMRRDTIQIPSLESATLRVVADNPGTWFFHCHIEWHLEVGLAILLVEAPLEVQKLGPIPSFLGDQCKDLGVSTTGNAAGHLDPKDLAGLPAGPFPQILGWRPRGSGAMAGCVLAATIGMLSVVWYSLGGHVSEEEMEHEARLHQEAKAKRGRLFGLIKPKA